MDDRLSAAPVVGQFGGLVKEWVAVEALYVGGSLAGGDYRPEVSDLDAVAIVHGRLDVEDRRRLEQHHRDFEVRCPEAVRLHCIYVAVQAIVEVDAEHPMWSERRVTDRCLSQMARVELARNGISVYGPPPSTFFRDADAAALRSAARAELVGYWQSAVAKPSLWWSDWCVDLGLVTIARADAAIREDRLITKREAIDRLRRFGVPERLAREIRQRRDGISRDRSFLDRVRRGRTARRLVSQAISDLIAATDAGAVEHPG